MKHFMKDSKKVTYFLEFHNSESSRRQYEYHLRLFFEWKQITDIDKYIKDPRLMSKKEKIQYEDKIKEDILSYWKFINEESDRFHSKTPYAFLSPMRRLLETYEIVFSPEFWRNIRKNGHGNYAITDFQTPTKKQLKDILSNADCEARALFLMQMTSGQRIEQIVNLRWGDVQLEPEYPRIFIRRQKGKRPIHTRITPEAKEYLMQYKEQYDRILQTREKRTPKNTRKALDRERIFPMSHTNAERMWNNLTDKVSLYVHDPVTKYPLYGTHCLRRYFQQHLGNENDALFFMGKTPENIATYLRYSPEQLDVVYIKGAENLVVFKEKSELPNYLNEYDEKMNNVTEKLQNSKDREELYKERLKSQEERLKKIENILIRNLQDSVDPFEGKPLSREEDEFEDQLTDKMILEKERKLKHLIATDPRYKDSEIVYTDQSWDDKTQRFKPGAPFLIKKKSPTGEKTFMDEMVDKMNEENVLNILANYDKKKQQELINQANKMKQRKTSQQ
jgi:integrase